MCRVFSSSGVVHIVSGSAGYCSSRSQTPKKSGGMLLFLQGAETGVAPVLWASGSPPPPSVSSDKLRAAALFERRPIFSWVWADPFGTSLQEN